MTEEELFRDYGALVTKLALRFREKYPKEDLDDLISEANLALLVAKESYQEGKCKFSSWAYQCIYFGLLTLCQKQQPKEKPTATGEINLEDKGSKIESWNEELSSEGKALVRDILQAPTAVLKYMTPKKVRRYLSDHWEVESLNRAWREVQTVVTQ